MERNRYVIVFSYYRFWLLLLILPALIATDIATAFLSILGGWFDMKCKVYRDLLSPKFWKWIMKRRRAIQSTRTVDDRELFKQAVGTIEFQESSIQNPIVKYIGNPVLKAYWFVIRFLLV